jgi:hypothetical protein
VTADVEAMVSPDGDVEVMLAVEDQQRRWFRRSVTYLSRAEARRVANDLLEAAGFQYAAVLDEELARLKEAADTTTSVEDHERLVMLRSMVQVMRKMFPEAAH